ncbi:MAG: nucleotidyl transferase AbiEii/AbiGii toxin family protein [Prevotellaceae bacterium]|jgi:hypothetical protein|nr:nucleotidyl transferase AbiEii/AbiGii toxin family protein [Prevotellaceae bacterium]
MNDFWNLTDKQRRTVITQTANKANLPEQAIEKDLWVTTILQLVFSLPYANHLLFKGGTSLSKGWRLIERFSEDIDLAIDRKLFNIEGDLTTKQIKKLRKQSSLFVREEFYMALQDAVCRYGMQQHCEVKPEGNGEGDNTYPEPRKIFIRYHSLFDKLDYLSSEIVLEIGARSLIEPTEVLSINSLISERLPIQTALATPRIIVALPKKTFLEKAFLLHELFTGDGDKTANRKSRHLYDLEKMMDKEFAVEAIADTDLWNNIQHHRSVFTSMKGVDYQSDIRHHICLIPPQQVMSNWKQDYESMKQSMIYEKEPLRFEELIHRIEELQNRFHGHSPS